MREIKFRAWGVKQNKFLGDYQHIIFHFVGKSIIVLSGFGYEWLKPDKDIIMQQFTGLKDKNGKEIYEGDIIKIDLYNGEDNKIVVVEWKNGGFFPLTLYALKCEVIGNIYENPELLN